MCLKSLGNLAQIKIIGYWMLEKDLNHSQI